MPHGPISHPHPARREPFRPPHGGNAPVPFPKVDRARPDLVAERAARAAVQGERRSAHAQAVLARRQMIRARIVAKHAELVAAHNARRPQAL